MAQDNDCLPTNGVTIVYDGDCPLCRAYIAMVRLREAAGNVQLTDARQAPALVSCLADRGYSLEDGLVARVDGQLYHGAQAMHVLALLSSRHGWFNRLNYVVFRSQRLSRMVYPLLVRGRRLLLKILRRQPIDATAPESYHRISEKIRSK